MTKAILSASVALSSVFCMIVSLRMLATNLDCRYALIAMLFGFCTIASIGWGIEDTKIGDKLSNLFAEDDDDE